MRFIAQLRSASGVDAQGDDCLPSLKWLKQRAASTCNPEAVYLRTNSPPAI